MHVQIVSYKGCTVEQARRLVGGGVDVMMFMAACGCRAVSSQSFGRAPSGMRLLFDFRPILTS